MVGCRISEVAIDYRERIGETTLARWNSGKTTMKRLFRPASEIRAHHKPAP